MESGEFRKQDGNKYRSNWTAAAAPEQISEEKPFNDWENDQNKSTTALRPFNDWEDKQGSSNRWQRSATGGGGGHIETQNTTNDNKFSYDRSD